MLVVVVDEAMVVDEAIVVAKEMVDVEDTMVAVDYLLLLQQTAHLAQLQLLLQDLDVGPATTCMMECHADG